MLQKRTMNTLLQLPPTRPRQLSMLLILAALSTILSGCLNPGFGFGRGVVSSGKIVTETRAVGSFDAINLTGNGNVSVQAISSLDVTISGSGNVRYAGNPTVTTDISGSGDVKRR